MKLCILGQKEPSDCEKWLIEEGRKVFDSCTYVKIPTVRIGVDEDGAYVKSGKSDLTKFDCVLPRIPRTYRNYSYAIIKALIDSGVHVPLTPESVLITHNKFYTLLLLKKAGLPVPETYLAATRKAIEQELKQMKYPIVLKYLYGSLGRGVMFADSYSSAISVMDMLEEMKEPIFLEEWLPNAGEDIRALVIGDQVVASMKRIAQKGEKRTNIGIGGAGKSVELSDKLKDLAIHATKALGLGICGVDIMESRGKPYLIEANVNVHFEGLTTATKLNIAKMMVEYVRDSCQKSGSLRKRIKNILRSG